MFGVCRQFDTNRLVSVGILISVLYALWAWLCFPWAAAYELNPDEGINLAKGALVAAGYGLYRDIWSDQPPVFSHALGMLQHWWPWNVAAARMLVLGCACVTLVSLWSLVRRAHGWLAAALAVLLLGASPLFVQLSVSVMVGLPAMALGLAAMAFLPPAGPLHRGRLLLAGVVMALSLQTKLFTLLLLPAMLLMLWQSSRTTDRWRGAAWFLMSLLAGTLLLAGLAGKAFLEQLVHPHFSASLRDEFSLWDNAETIWHVLRRQPLLWMSGLLGGLAMCRAKWRELLPPIWCFVLVMVALLGHTPVWPHHVLLLMPALAWVGSVALAQAVVHLRAMSAPWGASLAVACVSVVIGLSVTVALLSPRHDKAELTKRSAGAVVQRFAGLGGWMVTDAPMDAFRAGLLVPPELAVYTWKRLKVRALTGADVIKAIRVRKPQQVGFRRFPVDPTVRAHLDQHYLLTYQGDGFTHYVAEPDKANPADAARSRAALHALIAAFASTSVGGGYAGGVRLASPMARFGETAHYPISPEAVYMRPPGSTPRVGDCFLQAYKLTGLVQQLELARQAARAVVRSQRCDGGWMPAADGPGACGGASEAKGPHLTFDEGMMAEAIVYLLDVRQTSPGDAVWLTPSIHKALNFLISTQDAQGGWPYALSGPSYARYTTINDDLTTSHIRVLLRAHAELGRKDALDAARRGVEFLLRSQSPDGGWGQQYDEQAHIVAARSFEPAALSSLETAYVIRTLLDADSYLADPRLRMSVRRAVDWLNRVALAQDWWARFYELGTNRPIYQDRKGHVYRTAEALPLERRLGYRWEESFPEVSEAMVLASAGDPGVARRVGERLRMVNRVAQVAKAKELLASGATLSPQGPLTDAQGIIWSRRFLEQCRIARAVVGAGQRSAPEDDLELQHP